MSTLDDFKSHMSGIMQEKAEREYRNSNEFEHADNFYNQFANIVKTTDKTLKDDEILIIRIHLNNGQTIIALDFEYRIPNMLIVHGIDELNNQITIVCHQSNVQLSLQVIKKQKNEPKKIFGFAPIPSE